MQIRPQGWLCLTAFAALAAGCATDSRTSQSDARNARLPTGVTLLDSNRDDCAGTVAIDDSVVAGARREDLVIQRGENATFEVRADDDDDVAIKWTCVGTANTERETVNCPDQTSWVRVTRAAGNDFLLECYGERGSSATRRARGR
ncbi:MAG TPA: hypothetical protein VF405_04845 [Gammaproteobacteria bacterium]